MDASTTNMNPTKWDPTNLDLTVLSELDLRSFWLIRFALPLELYLFAAPLFAMSTLSGFGAVAVGHLVKWEEEDLDAEKRCAACGRRREEGGAGCGASKLLYIYSSVNMCTYSASQNSLVGSRTVIWLATTCQIVLSHKVYYKCHYHLSSLNLQ